MTTAVESMEDGGGAADFADLPARPCPRPEDGPATAPAMVPRAPAAMHRTSGSRSLSNPVRAVTAARVASASAGDADLTAYEPTTPRASAPAVRAAASGSASTGSTAVIAAALLVIPSSESSRIAIPRCEASDDRSPRAALTTG